MRTRRFANTERIRSKERRLHQVNLRRDLALLHGVLPKGVLTDVLHTTTGTTSTVHTPLRALVATAEETWRVDFADVPDPTGGFDDVVIPAGKQVGELASDATVSFAGQSVGDYVVYAQHSLVDENPETREPPGKYAGGTGVFPEHRAFFNHGKADGQPIPREGYDSTLTPETVSEAVDRLTIAFAPADSVPANATPLLSVTWNGTSVASSTVIARTLDFTTLYDHIGSGGNAHAVATPSTAGFQSAADKQALDAATHLPNASTLMKRDVAGRAKVATPATGAGGVDDAANRGYVDSAVSAGIASIPLATVSEHGLMSNTDKAKLNSATAAATASQLMMRDAAGRAKVASPSTGTDIANKDYVDDALGRTFDLTYTGSADGHALMGPGFVQAALLPVAVPSGHRLVLRRVRYRLTATSTRVGVTGPSGSWQSTDYSGDQALNIVLASTVGTHNIDLRLVLTVSGNQIIGQTPSCIVATLAIEPV